MSETRWTAEQEVEAVKQQLPSGAWRKGASLARCVEDLRMDRDHLARRLAELEAELSRLRALTTWQPIETAPKHRRCYVTNNIKALDANGQMSHVWIGFPIKSDNGEWVTFDGDWVKVHSLTHWMPLPAPAGSGSREK